MYISIATVILLWSGLKVREAPYLCPNACNAYYYISVANVYRQWQFFPLSGPTCCLLISIPRNKLLIAESNYSIFYWHFSAGWLLGLQQDVRNICLAHWEISVILHSRSLSNWHNCHFWRNWQRRTILISFQKRTFTHNLRMSTSFIHIWI